jgi:hypothetical protein
MPKRPRLRPKRGPGSRVSDDWLWWNMPSLDFDFDDALALAGAVVAVVVIVMLAVTLVFPLIALTLELIVVVLLFTGGLLGRLLLGRPWRVEARTIGTPRYTRAINARGLRGSREAVDELADAIRSGQTLSGELPPG